MPVRIQDNFSYQSPVLPDDRTRQETVADALLIITPNRRAIGLEVLITSLGVKYWWKDDVTDEGFVPMGKDALALPVCRSVTDMASTIDECTSLSRLELSPLDPTVSAAAIRLGCMVVDRVGRFGAVIGLTSDDAQIVTISVPATTGIDGSVIDSLSSNSATDALAARQGTLLMNMLMKPDEAEMLHHLIEDLTSAGFLTTPP